MNIYFPNNKYFIALFSRRDLTTQLTNPIQLRSTMHGGMVRCHTLIETIVHHLPVASAATILVHHALSIHRTLQKDELDWKTYHELFYKVSDNDVNLQY